MNLLNIQLNGKMYIIMKNNFLLIYVNIITIILINASITREKSL